MIKALFFAVIYQPIYNLLTFLLDIIPGGDLGLAVILVTLIIKLILSPLSIKAVKTQMAVKEIEPEVRKLQEKHKDDKQAQAIALMDLYKTKKVKPFSGFLLLLIQIPVILALYYIILRGGFPEVRTDILYSFIPVPASVDLFFLGSILVTSKSILLALLTGVTQFIQIKLTVPTMEKKDPSKEASFKDDFARSMHFQMKFIFPVFITIIAYTLSAVVALYFITSNLFQIGQELYVRAHVKKNKEVLES